MGDDLNQRGNSRRWIMRAFEDSLRRLGTDWIDVYQVHRPDPSTDVEETLVRAHRPWCGRARSATLGSSTFPASQIVEAQVAARDRNLERFVTEQPPYSILVRGVEADVLPTCARHGMAVMSYSPSRAAGCQAAGARTLASRSPRAPAAPRTVRPVQPVQPAQARCGRRAGAARRADRAHADPASHRVRSVAPCDHLAADRPTHDGAAGDQLAAADVVLSATCSTGSTRSCRQVSPSTQRQLLHQSRARAHSTPPPALTYRASTNRRRRRRSLRRTARPVSARPMGTRSVPVTDRRAARCGPWL
jgi:hypothetical protein